MKASKVIEKYTIEPNVINIKFRSESFQINEYTLRNIQLAIKKGEIIPEEIMIEDNITIDKNGRLSDNLPQFSISYNLAIQLLH